LLPRARRLDSFFLLRPCGRPLSCAVVMAREAGVAVEPQEIEDEGHEQILERVAAVDVAKASGMVCTRVPDPARPGRRKTLVWQVDATMNAILELAGHLVAERIQKITLESTSDYWRIWYYLLETAGLEVQLVRARDVKQAPGRAKTDKIDCVWQAKCTERGLLRPSFVPPAEIRALRDYTRLRIDLTRERTRHYSRLEKLLEDAQLTELTEVVVVSGVPGGTRAVRFAARDHRWDWPAGLVVFGGAARRCA
jgi:Transposase